MAKDVDRKTIEAAALREWQADAALREEFSGVFAVYAAFCLADARGLVRIYNSQRTRPSGGAR